MSSLMTTPGNVPGPFTPATAPAQPGGAAPVNAAPPPRFMDDPKPAAPTPAGQIQEYVSSPNSVPLAVFHKLVKGDPSIAERFAPGITQPKGYLLLQPDAQTGKPLVALKDPIGFAAYAKQAMRDADQEARMRAQAVEPQQGVPFQMDSAGNALSADEIKRRADVKAQDLPVEESEVQPGDLLMMGHGVASLGIHALEGAAGKAAWKIATAKLAETAAGKAALIDSARALEIAGMPVKELMAMHPEQRAKIVGEFADFLKDKYGMVAGRASDVVAPEVEQRMALNMERAAQAKTMKEIPESVGKVVKSSGGNADTVIGVKK